MEQERRHQRQNAVPPRRTQRWLSWTPRHSGVPNKKKNEVSWARIGEAGG
jgi:hypothetical protein